MKDPLAQLKRYNDILGEQKATERRMRDLEHKIRALRPPDPNTIDAVYWETLDIAKLIKLLRQYGEARYSLQRLKREAGDLTATLETAGLGNLIRS
ncbi:MAG: hypothetical protein OXG65_13545 [Chloroflexi bacterium]|nr:hypothetical protein [Chloroflexota bacterium]